MSWKMGLGIAAALAASSGGAASGQMREGSYRVAIVGDSLATGAGIGAEKGYPAVMQQLAVNERWPVRITVHAGNGETTANGVRRMSEVLATRPDVVVLALGGNDGLQARAPEETRANLEQMVRSALTTGAQVVLTGMEAPPNASMDYRIRFRAAFSRLGRTMPIWFMPFLLEGVALNPRLNQSDGVHPNEGRTCRRPAGRAAPHRHPRRGAGQRAHRRFRPGTGRQSRAAAPRAAHPAPTPEEEE